MFPYLPTMLLKLWHISKIPPIQLICTALNHSNNALILTHAPKTHTHTNKRNIKWHKNLQPGTLFLYSFFVSKLQSNGFDLISINNTGFWLIWKKLQIWLAAHSNEAQWDEIKTGVPGKCRRSDWSFFELRNAGKVEEDTAPCSPWASIFEKHI